MENRISITVPADVEAAFNAKINEAFQIIKPFLVTVSDDDKPNLLKLGDKLTPFVQRTNEYTDTDPDYIPNYLDLPEFKRDFTALLQFDRLNRNIEKLQGGTDDTRSLLANDSFSGALLYYRNLKTAADSGDARAKVIYEDLSKWFPGRSTAKKAS